jgi:hypothetical protein
MMYERDTQQRLDDLERQLDRCLEVIARAVIVLERDESYDTQQLLDLLRPALGQSQRVEALRRAESQADNTPPSIIPSPEGGLDQVGS